MPQIVLGIFLGFFLFIAYVATLGTECEDDFIDEDDEDLNLLYNEDEF